MTRRTPQDNTDRSWGGCLDSARYRSLPFSPRHAGLPL